MPRRVYRRKRILRKRGYKGVRTSRSGIYVGGPMPIMTNRYPSISRSLALGIHYFKRSINGQLDANNLVADNIVCIRDNTNNCFFLQNPVAQPWGTKLYGELSYQFSIENLPAVSDFVNLFDAYRINKVVVKIIPRATSVDVSSSGATNYQEGPSPLIHYCKDYDDVTFPGASQNGIDAIRQYPSYKCKRMVGQKPIKIILSPKPVSTVYGYNTGLLLNPRKMGAWMNSSHTNIKHYGLKFIMEYLTPNNSSQWRFNFEIETTYYMAFKGVR